jgi:hypothetical protein
MSKIARDPLYHRHRFPAEIIAHAVWLYFRFPLSLRMVEDMLAARGIIVTHQTIRTWAEKFGRHFANEIRRRSAGRRHRKVIGRANTVGPRVLISGGRDVRDFVPRCHRCTAKITMVGR